MTLAEEAVYSMNAIRVSQNARVSPVSSWAHAARSDSNRTDFFLELPMKLIPLTQGRIAIVDDEDFEWLSQWNWHAGGRPRNEYASRSEPRLPPIASKGPQRTIKMHRLIMNPPKGYEVDHINGDTFDNRRTNLRICTRAENCRNRLPTIGRRFKGAIQRESGNWRSMIRSQGRLIHIGTFRTEIDAAKAYDAKAKELFDEFAHLNFPEEVPCVL